MKPGGIFLNLDLVNAPTAGQQQHYARVTEKRRGREAASRDQSEAQEQQVQQTPRSGAGLVFPAHLTAHLEALSAAGFQEVDCFWKDLRQALYGGYV